MNMGVVKSRLIIKAESIGMGPGFVKSIKSYVPPFISQIYLRR